jgi:predicted transcriptional regulator
LINDENLISNGTRESETIFFSQYSLNDFNLELKTVIRELKWNRENMSNIYKAVLKKICEEIVDKYNNVLDCRIHILPENLDKDVEYIFKVNPDLTDDELLVLRSEVDYDVFRIYDKFNLEYDFANVYSRY